MPVSHLPEWQAREPSGIWRASISGILSDSGVKPGFGKRSFFHGKKILCSEILTVSLKTWQATFSLGSVLTVDSPRIHDNYNP